MCPLYISLTSIFGNQHMLLQTLQSISNQTHTFDKCFIFLSEEPYLQDAGFQDKLLTNVDLIKFINNNKDKFEVRWVDNLGPYRKILNLLKEKLEEDCLILYIDDDVIYEKNFIKRVIDNYNVNKCCINCRGFTFELTKDWTYRNRKTLIPKHLYNFATGKGGVLLKPIHFNNTKDIMFNSNLIRELCPFNEDIWMTFMRICNGVECYVDNYQFFDEELSIIGNRPRSLYDNYNKEWNDFYINRTINKLVELKYLHIG